MSVVVAIVCPEGAVLGCDSRECDPANVIVRDDRQKWAKSSCGHIIAAWTGALNCGNQSMEDVVSMALPQGNPTADTAANAVAQALDTSRDGSEGATYVFLAGPSAAGKGMELWYVEAPAQQVSGATATLHFSHPCKDFRGNDSVRHSLVQCRAWLSCTPCAVGLSAATAACCAAVAHVISDTNVPTVGGACTVLAAQP